MYLILIVIFMFIINKKFLKLILVLSIFILFTGCSTPSKLDLILTENDIKVQILHHEVEENENMHFLGFIVTIPNNKVSKEDIYIEIEGLDSFCTINQELTNNSKYTTDFINEKIEVDDTYINFIECYIVDTNRNIYKNIKSNIDIIVNYKFNKIKATGFIFSEI